MNLPTERRGRDVNYGKINRLNEQLDQQTDDFRLEELEDENEAREMTDRREESQRVSLFLSGFMNLVETAGCAALIMHHYSSERDSFYRDENGNESLFYRGFEIAEREGRWMFENEDQQSQIFFNSDLLSGLRVINEIIGD